LTKVEAGLGGAVMTAGSAILTVILLFNLGNKKPTGCARSVLPFCNQGRNESADALAAVVSLRITDRSITLLQASVNEFNFFVCLDAPAIARLQQPSAYRDATIDG
jgi:hypothetical protein